MNQVSFSRKNTRNVELQLIEDELRDIDLQLERAEHALNWNSEGMDSIQSFNIALFLRITFLKTRIMLLLL